MHGRIWPDVYKTFLHLTDNYPNLKHVINDTNNITYIIPQQMKWICLSKIQVTTNSMRYFQRFICSNAYSTLGLLAHSRWM